MRILSCSSIAPHQRRWGRRSAYKGRFHDAVRSQTGHVVTVLWDPLGVPDAPGVWLWCQRGFALPMLSVLTQTPATSAKLGRRHRTTLRSCATATVISKPGVKPKKGPRQPKLTEAG
jgi:hypothetical protein